MSNFAMGTILGKGFPQAQVHTVHSTSVGSSNLTKLRNLYYLEKSCCFIKFLLNWKNSPQFSGT